jgi:ATP phosphoribosyltransferase
MVIVFIVTPKNSGLKEYKQKALQYLGTPNNKIIEVRGEDVPYWIIEFKKNNKKAIGFTGEDLFNEFCLRQPENKLKIINKINWNDSNAKFKKPALCLLIPKDISFKELKKELRIVIPDKYVKIADKYLESYEKQGYFFNKIYMKGCVESACTQGIADIAIDIVYTGSSLLRDNLAIYDVIMKSDFVIIGDKND